MKSTLFQVGKKLMPLQNIQHPSSGLYIALAWIFDIDKNVIQINNNKDVQFFNQNLIDITLEARQSIE